MFSYKDNINTIVFSPSKTTTGPQQVHEGHTDETIHIQDQVGFLKVQIQTNNIGTIERGIYLKMCVSLTDWIFTLDVVIFSTSRA